MIKGVKTLIQFKLKKWVQENFAVDGVEVSYMNDNSATIANTASKIMDVTYDEIEGVKHE